MSRRKWGRNLSNKPKQKSTYTIPLRPSPLWTYHIPVLETCMSCKLIGISYLGPRPASYLHPLGVFSYQLSWHYGPGCQSREEGRKSQIPTRFSLYNIAHTFIFPQFPKILVTVTGVSGERLKWEIVQINSNHFPLSLPQILTNRIPNSTSPKHTHTIQSQSVNRGSTAYL